MNLASFLLCLVFAAIGYVIQPLLLPELVSAKMVSESVLSDDYRKLHMPPEVKPVASVKNPPAQDPVVVQDQPKAEPNTQPRIIDEAVDTDPVLPEVPADIAEKANPDAMPTDNTVPETAAVEPVKPVFKDTPQAATPPSSPATSGSGLATSELTKMMKASVQNGDVQEFSFENTTKWNNKGTQTINGEKYQVGEVTYRARTIFGDEILRAKALFQNGQLIKWVWPTTNADMK